MEKRVQDLETKVATIDVTVSTLVSSIGKLTEVMEENTKAIRDNDSTMQVFIAKHESLDTALKDQALAHKEDIKGIKTEIKEAKASAAANSTVLAEYKPTIDQFKKINTSIIVALLGFAGTLMAALVYFVKLGGT